MATQKKFRGMVSTTMKPTFTKRTRSKRGNVVVSKGWSGKGGSKVETTIGYKTKTGKKKLVITTMKKIVKRK